MSVVPVGTYDYPGSVGSRFGSLIHGVGGGLSGTMDFLNRQAQEKMLEQHSNDEHQAAVLNLTREASDAGLTASDVGHALDAARSTPSEDTAPPNVGGTGTPQTPITPTPTPTYPTTGGTVPSDIQARHVGRALEAGGPAMANPDSFTNTPTPPSTPGVSAAAGTPHPGIFGRALNTLSTGGYQAPPTPTWTKTGPTEKETAEQDRLTAKHQDVQATNEAAIRKAEIMANARIQTAHVYMNQSGLNSDPVGKQLSEAAKSAEAQAVEQGKTYRHAMGDIMSTPDAKERAQQDYTNALQNAADRAKDLSDYADKRAGVKPATAAPGQGAPTKPMALKPTPHSMAKTALAASGGDVKAAAADLKKRGFDPDNVVP